MKTFFKTIALLTIIFGLSFRINSQTLFQEGFQSTTFPPTSWQVFNPDNNVTWLRSVSAGGFGTSTASAMMDNFNPSTDITGQVDKLISIPVDMSSYTSVSLEFNVAYARYSAATTDTLKVEVSTDGGSTWLEVLEKDGSFFSTAPDLTTALFIPTSSQWNNFIVDISSFVGNASVLIAFNNISDWGNAMYLDNIKITYSTLPIPVVNFSANPIPIMPGGFVNFTDLSTNSPLTFNWTFTGGNPSSSNARNPSGIQYSTAGTYSVTLKATNSNGTGTKTKTDYIIVSEQDITPKYAIGMGGTSNDYGNSIVLDAFRNTYITGSFQGTTDFDPGPAIVNLTSAGNSDIFIAKYDNIGNLIFAKCMGGTSEDISNSIALDGSGNIYITGYFTGTADFDPGPGIVEKSATNPYKQIFLAKYNYDGNLVFANYMPEYPTFSSGTCIGQSVVVDGFGNSYLTGYFAYTIDFDPGSGAKLLTSTNNFFDIFIAKYDKLGKIVFAKNIGSTENDKGYKITVDNSRNIYITGYFQGTTDFDPGTGTVNLTSAGFEDIYLAKYDSSGNFKFAKKMGGTSADAGYSIVVDNSGNTFITGMFQGTSDFDPGAGTFNFTSAGGSDVFFSKYDNVGNLVIAKKMGGTGNDFGLGIAVDISGNINVTGSFFGTCNFDPGGQELNLTAVGGSDIFITKYENSGNIIYAKRIGSSSSDGGSSIVVDDLLNSYLTGYFSATTDFNPEISTSNLTSNGGTDIFIAKFSRNCTTTPTITVNGSTTFCKGDSVTLTASTGSSYLWSTGATTKSISVSPNTTQNYSVIVTDDMICTASSEATTLTVSNPVAIISASDTSICIWDSVILTANSSKNYLWNNGSTTQNITVKSSGNYSLQITDSLNCEATSPIHHVSIKPEIPVISASGPTTFCTGGSVTLTSSIGFRYNWSNNGATTQSITVSPTTSISYYVYVFDSLGCSEYSNNFKITVNPMPVPLFTPNQTVFTTPPFALQFTNQTTNISNNTYNWFFGDDSTSNSANVTVPHEYQNNGSYTVKLIATTAEGCMDSLIKADYILCSGKITCAATAVITASKNTGCVGDSIVLQGNIVSGYTYQWSINGAPIVGAILTQYYAKQSGNFTLTTNDGNCSTTSSPLLLIFNPVTVPVITQNGILTFCPPNTVDLQATAGYTSYLWSTGETTQNITINKSGVYTTEVIDNNGCVSISDPFSLNASMVPPTPICLVTVDSTSTKNVIIWEKPTGVPIDSFRIYREIGFNNYVPIGSVAYSALSTFTDTTNGINPKIQSYRYKISVIDTCANESVLSSHHRTIHLSTPQFTAPSTFDLIWTNDYEGFTVSNYYILRDGNGTGNWIKYDSVTFGNLSYTDINAPSSNARYIIEALHPGGGCTVTKSTKTVNSTKSNTSDKIIPTEVNKYISELNVKIYPNPNTGIFTVTISDSRFRIYHLRLMNVLGAIVYSLPISESVNKSIMNTQMTNAEIKIDLPFLPVGIYSLQLQTETGAYIKKLVKE